LKIKIKLALLDKDVNYIQSITNAFNCNYSQNIEVYSFTDEKKVIEEIKNNRINMLIADQYVNINPSELPAHCMFAYFVETNDIETINNQKAICKFQKISAIYKNILSIYSEKSEQKVTYKKNNKNVVSKMISFVSVNGGAGSSVASVACAIKCAQREKKTLHLNFEQFGESDFYLSADGSFDLTDVLFALKSQKCNLALKIESAVLRDSKGVYFFKSPINPLDKLEISKEECLKLISELKENSEYEYIIVNLDFNITENFITFLDKSDQIILLTEKNILSKEKLKKEYKALDIISKRNAIDICSKISLIENKITPISDSYNYEFSVQVLGALPLYNQNTVESTINSMVSSGIFNEI